MTEMRPWMLPVAASDLMDVLALQDEDDAPEDFFGLAIAHVAGAADREAKISALMRAKELVSLIDDERLAGLVVAHADGDVSIARPLIDLAATHPLHVRDGLATPSFFEAAARLMEVSHG